MTELNAQPAASPAKELRAAAAELRLKAKYATDGPWTCSPVWSPDSKSTSGVYSLAHPTGTVESEVVASGRIKSGYGGIRNPHNALWLTYMQPSIAAPLADWMDDCATRWEEEINRDRGECPSCESTPGCNHPEHDFHDGSASRAGCERSFDGPDGDRCDCFDHVLAVARALNGGQS